MMQDTSTLFCDNHPNRETSLRCNRCNKPICAKCAVSTPTGYRCPQCVRGHQKTFDTTEWYDYPIAFFLALILAFIGSQLVRFIGFFTILLAPVAGIVIAEAVRIAVRKRRSKRLYQVATVGAAVGSVIPLLGYLVTFLLVLTQGNFGGLGFLLPLVWQGLYTFIVISTMYYRLSGIRL
jgi:MFS family permease